MQNSTKPSQKILQPQQLPEQDLKKDIQETYFQPIPQSKNHFVSYVTKLSMRQKSPYADTYFEDFVQARTLLNFESVKQKVNQSKSIFFNDLKTPQVFGMKKIRETRNKKIMEFQVVFSFFVTHLRVLNIDSKDNLSLNLKNWINQGGYGAIYSVEIDKKKYAVKKLSIENQDPGKSVKNALKEYCFMKLCGVLQIGPAYQQLFGFDLITTQNAIYFSCELGVPVYQYVRSNINGQKDLQRDFDILKKSLILLHTLRINHNDIKTSNIVYSQTFKKLVLLDFGLSDVNSLDIGYIKLEKPKGSIEYCCDDMKKLFFDNFSEGLVDLYYNDIIALTKSFLNIKSILKTSNCHDFNKKHNLINQHNNVSNGIMLNDNDIYLFQDDQTQNKQFYNFNPTNQQTEQIIIFNIVSLIDLKDVAHFQNIIKSKSSYLKILLKHLRPISFVFFQTGKDTALQSIYRIVKKLVQASIQILPETYDCLNFELQPYFNITLSRLLRNCNSYLNQYLEQKKGNSSIAQRYNENVEYYDVRKSRIQLNKKYTEITVHSMQDTKQVQQYLMHCLQKFGSQYVSEVINLQMAKIHLYYYWHEITQIQINSLQDFLLQLHLKIHLQFLNPLGQPIPVKLNQKLVFYINIFLNFYLQIIQEFDLCSLTSKLIQQDTPQNLVLGQQIFNSINKLTRKHTESHPQSEKYHTNSRQQSIKSFTGSNNCRFANMQYCLNIIQKLSKILQPYYDYQYNLSLNHRMCDIIDEKIRQIVYIYYEIYLYEHKKGYPTSIFKSAHLFFQIILTKFRNHKRRILSQIFSCTRAANDYAGSIEVYQRIFYEFECLKLYDIFTAEQISGMKLKELFYRRQQQMNMMNEWYFMEKDIYQAVIFTSIVPYSEPQKFNRQQSYFNALNRKKPQDFYKISSFAAFFMISSAYNLANDVDDYKALQNIIKIVSQTQRFIANMNFCSIIYECVKKCNNSKKVKQCERDYNICRKFMPKIKINQYHYLCSQAQSVQSFSKLSMDYKNHLQKALLQQQTKQGTADLDNRLNLIELQKFIRTEWERIIESQQKLKFYDSSMIELRYLLTRIFYYKDSDQQQIKFIYMKYSYKYDQEVSRYERWLQQKLNKVQKLEDMKRKISVFFHISPESEQYFWQRIKAVHFLLNRQKLLRILTFQFYFTSQIKSEIHDRQWYVFNSKYHQLQPKPEHIKFTTSCYLHERSLQIYSEIKFRFLINKLTNSIYLNPQKQQCPQSIEKFHYQKIQCIRSFMLYVRVQLLKIERLKSNNINSQIQHVLFDKNLSTGFNYVIQIMCQQSFIRLILLSSQNIIEKTLVEKLIAQDSNVSKFFKGKFDPEQLLQHSFETIVASNRIHQFFYLKDFGLRFLYYLIQIGVNSLVSEQKQNSLNGYFLSYIFYNLIKFAESQSCSSYSYFILGLVNYFRQQLFGRLLKSKQKKITVQYKYEGDSSGLNHDRIGQSKNLRKQTDLQETREMRIGRFFQRINDFEKDLIKVFIEDQKQSKMVSVVTLLISCQKIKLQILIDSLRNQQTRNKDSQMSSTIKYQQIPLKNQTQLMQKIQYFICFNINRLQSLSKSYMRHYFYCYLVMLNLGNKKYHLFSSPFIDHLAFARSQSSKIKVQKTYPPQRFSNFSLTQPTIAIDFQRYLNQIKEPQFILQFPSNKSIQKRQRYFEVKHLRNTRKIIDKIKKNLSNLFIQFQLHQKYYYSVFEPIDSTSLLRIGLKKVTVFQNKQNGDPSCETCVEVYNWHQLKVQRLIKIACMDTT